MTEKFHKFLCEVDRDFPTPLSQRVNLSEYAKKLARNAFLSFTADGDVITGCVAMYCNDTVNLYAYIPLVAVISRCRGRHLSRALMSCAITYARDNGFKTLGLHTENAVALNLYLSLGFRIVDDSPRKYLELTL